ncbi:MAG: leucyl aminopeptidase [Gammaproteobacteria bacterium]|nr:MAG: leucyl aminopeptidase [Gammaproteobacteria bacterium]
MKHDSKHAQPQNLKTPCLVVGIFDHNRGDTNLDMLDQASEGALRRILKKGDFQGRNGETLMLYGLPGVAATRVLLLGLGKQRELTARSYGEAIGKAIRQLQEANVARAAIALPDEGDSYQMTRQAVIAAEAAVYRFDECKSDAKGPRRPLTQLTFATHDRRHLRRMQKACSHGSAIANGSRLAKDLGNLPGNICTPTYLAEQARKLARGKRRLKVTILEEKDMEKLGMGALLSVSRGSSQPAKLIVMEYKGGKPGSKPVALVGKGLTFDAGGISIKPAQAMDEMKYDMCGGASVFGAIAACLELELPINVVGVVPSSENLPDGNANKPGDIVTSMSGQTIEVLNTDAEGRLILCDALTYTERFEPAAVVDIATLTGACIIALGHHASGLMANDDRLAEELNHAGEAANDRVWRLPLWDDYQKQLDSNFADMANIGGRPAGTITAACFLSRFAKKFKWAHLDIAGTAWVSGNDKGATGRPVPLLTQFLMKRARVVD